MLIAAGGFGLCGIPELLLEAIKSKTVSKDIDHLRPTIAGVDDFGHRQIAFADTKQVKKDDVVLCGRKR